MRRAFNATRLDCNCRITYGYHSQGSVIEVIALVVSKR